MGMWLAGFESLLPSLSIVLRATHALPGRCWEESDSLLGGGGGGGE